MQCTRGVRDWNEEEKKKRVRLWGTTGVCVCVVMLSRTCGHDGNGQDGTGIQRKGTTATPKHQMIRSIKRLRHPTKPPPPPPPQSRQSTQSIQSIQSKKKKTSDTLLLPPKTINTTPPSSHNTTPTWSIETSRNFAHPPTPGPRPPSHCCPRSAPPRPSSLRPNPFVARST